MHINARRISGICMHSVYYRQCTGRGGGEDSFPLWYGITISVAMWCDYTCGSYASTLCRMQIELNETRDKLTNTNAQVN